MSDEIGPGDPAEWTYSLGDQSYGPMTIAQLTAAAHAGLLPPHTSIMNLRTQVSQPAGLVITYAADPPVPSTRAGDDPAMRFLLPVGRSGWAIAAGYLGLVGWVLWPLAPFALISAELGRRHIAADPKKHGMGRVVVGYVGGAIGMIALLIVLLS